MHEHATSSYTNGDYHIMSDINSDIPDIITFTARHIKKLNDIFIGVTKRSGMDHKITCAFAYKKYNIEVIDNNKLCVILDLYDNTQLKIDLFKGNFVPFINEHNPW